MSTTTPDPRDEQVGVLVMSHGTPRSLDELGAFYTEIRRGRPPTTELLGDLERRYLAIGGTSPLTQRTAAQVAGIARCLEVLRPGRYVVRSGAKFAAPRIEDAVGELARAGVRRAIGVVLAPHSSVASVGDYRRRALAAARSTDAGADGPLEIEVVDHWYMAPGLVALLAERVRLALSSVSGARISGETTTGDTTTGDTTTGDTEVIFTAHSVPARLIDEGDGYEEQVHESARAVAEAARVDHWRVAWQSAGRTEEPWVGPDVREVISSLEGTQTTAVVVCPVGFVSDHLEILYDLDIEAAGAAQRAGLAFARTASLNDDSRFCEILARVVTAADPRAVVETER